MGDLERKSKKYKQWSNTKQTILTAVGLTGVVAVALVVPQTLSLLKTTSTGRKLANKLFYTKSTFWDLVNDGYIEVDPVSKKNARLTEKGKRKFLLSKQVVKPRAWDKKWRILTFDIKENRRGTRNTIRSILTRYGFTRLQQSVWVYPYDCEEFVSLLKVDQKIGKDVLYVIADQIENDKWLREHFGLPRN